MRTKTWKVLHRFSSYILWSSLPLFFIQKQSRRMKKGCTTCQDFTILLKRDCQCFNLFVTFCINKCIFFIKTSLAVVFCWSFKIKGLSHWDKTCDLNWDSHLFTGCKVEMMARYYSDLQLDFNLESQRHGIVIRNSDIK